MQGGSNKAILESVRKQLDNEPFCAHGSPEEAGRNYSYKDHKDQVRFPNAVVLGGMKCRLEEKSVWPVV